MVPQTVTGAEASVITLHAKRAKEQRTMKKLSLNLDDLQVESFTTRATDRPRGTVNANESGTEAGASDMLLQRTVLDFGHCANSAFRNAVVQSVVDLVGWVTTGVKPAS